MSSREPLGRASDFYGPGGNIRAWGFLLAPSAVRQGRVPALFRLDSIHTYHYIPDVAAGLATSAARGHVYGGCGRTRASGDAVRSIVGSPPS